MAQKEFVFVQMYFYETEAQERTMMNDFNEITEIYAPVNVINEHGVFNPKNTPTNTHKSSVRTRQLNILPNTTAPISGMYRINTVVVPYDSTNEDEVRKINLMIRRLGHAAEWFMMGDAEDMEKEYNTIPATLKASIYPYQLWMWIKYIQEKRQLLASLTDNTDRNQVKRAIETALQNIKDIYVDPIYPGCVEEFIQFAKNTPEHNFAKTQPEFQDHFRTCYKDFMLQVYIAVKAEGFGRTSNTIKTMIANMYEGLGIPSGEIMEIIKSMREGAAQERFRETEVDPLWNPIPTRSVSTRNLRKYSLGGGSRKRMTIKRRKVKGIRKSRRHQ